MRELANGKLETRNSKLETRNSKSILIISAFDPLEGEGRELIRYPILARELVEQGASVTYISSSFDHFAKAERTASVHDLPYQLHFISTPQYARNIGWRRLWNHYIFGKKLIAHLEASTTRFDAIISAFPPIGANIRLSKWAKEKGIPFFVDIQDLWPEAWLSKIPQGIGNGFAKRIITRRKKMIEGADGVIAVSEDYLRRLGWDQEKGKVFHLGGHFLSELADSRPRSEIRLILVAGSDHLPFLSILIAQMDELPPQVKLNLVGRSRAIREISPSDRISVHFDVTKDEKDKLLQQADWGLVLNDPSLHSRMPNKVFSYLSYGLPIISNLKGGELESLLKQEAWGAVCETDLSDFAQIVQGQLAHSAHFDKKNIYTRARSIFDKQFIYKAYAHYILKQLV
jgi:glycosyltransferase involved in cell wall biosynthesis